MGPISVRLITAVFLLMNISMLFAVKQESKDIATYRKSEVSAIPAYIRFNTGKEPLLADLRQWLISNYKLNPASKFILLGEEKDQLGFIHYRYKQVYNGIPIEASRLIAHTKSGRVHSLNGVLFDEIPSASGSSIINEKEALLSALKHVSAEKYKWEIESEITNTSKSEIAESYYPKAKLVYTLKKGKLSKNNLCLAYQFDIYATKPLYRAYVYVDAVNNTIVNEENRIHFTDVPGTANTSYSGTQTLTSDSYNGGFRLRESGRGNGIETYNLQQGTDYSSAVDFSDGDNVWNTVNPQLDQYATDAHWGTEKTYDYFWLNFNRNSIDNNGFKIKSYIHYDVDFFNAFWDGSVMTYGDGGSSMGATPLVCIDIVGHEITHGLTEHSAGLVYAGESGGLNESFSDIFGQCVEFYAKPNSASWLLGNEMGYTIRSMANPNAYDNPDTYHGQDWDPLEEVHNISGVQNFWFYLLSMGGTGTNDNGDNYNVTGIGLNDAAKIAFRNLTVYLTPNSNYSDARYYSIQSAIDLFGPCSPEVAATANAWYAVGVGGLYSNTVESDFNADFVSFCSVPAVANFENNSNNGVSFLWDFGDGTTSTQTSPSHSYTNYGVYTVKLTTSGGSCGTDSITKLNYITIDSSNICPISIVSGDSITQTECSGILTDDGGAANNYSSYSYGTVRIAPPGATQITLNFSSFDFESGYDYLNIYAGPDVSHPLVGSYSGAVLPNGGSLTINSGTITIEQTSDGYIENAGFLLEWQCSTNPVPPVANFTVDSTISCSGSVQFMDLSTNSPTSWLWNFGDGTTSTLQHPSHVYTADGLYTVSLQATNSVGTNSYSIAEYININSSFCNGVVMPTGSGTGTVQTSCFGILYDNGGQSGDYSDNTNSSVVIAPASATQITLNFIVFDMENNYDFIEIYDGTVISPNQLLGHYTGNTLPGGGSLTFNTGTITILQHSDYSVVGAGFGMSWICNTTPFIPNVNFSADSVSSCTGLVQFNDQSQGLPTSWWWDFGDGTNSTFQHPLHQYTNNGVYAVSLYASNNAGTGSYYASNYVHVNEAICSAILMPVDQSIVLTSCSGILSDNGGITGNYSDNTNSTATISPAGATQITLHFSQFEMETYYDSLFVYAGPSIASPLVGSFSGSSLPGSGTLSIAGGSVTIRHTSDYYYNMAGFEMQWDCGTANGIETNLNKENALLVYPNPATNDVTISYVGSGGITSLGLTISSAIGQRLFNTIVENTAGALSYKKTVDLSSFPNGIYFIEVNDGLKTTTRKFVLNR